MADERDPKVSKRYRELAREEPPRELDQSILAAARRAHDRPHAPLVTPAGRHRWYYAFGAAAILVLAVAVTVQIERQRPDPEMVPEAPVPQARTEDFSFKAPPKQVDPPKPESGFTPDPVPKRQEPPRELARDAAPETPAQAQSRVQENAIGAAASREEKAEARTDSAPRPMAAPAARARMAEQAAEPPERWLERIVQLRKEGRHEEAEKQLAEFRKRYPEYKIPEPALK
jgi:hypothetical protein